MEMCDCFVDVIEKHNEQLDALYGMAEILLETYPDVEDTHVNDAFCDVMNGMIEQSVQLCAVANCVGNVEWYMDESGFLFTDGMEVEECECHCEHPKISNYLN